MLIEEKSEKQTPRSLHSLLQQSAFPPLDPPPSVWLLVLRSSPALFVLLPGQSLRIPYSLAALLRLTLWVLQLVGLTSSNVCHVVRTCSSPLHLFLSRWSPQPQVVEATEQESY